MSSSNPSPIVTEVLRFEDLPPGSRGTRRAIARWSDGTESEALKWYADEILICEGDLIGKPASSCAPCTSAETATGSSPSACSAAGQRMGGRQRSLSHGSGRALGADAVACLSSAAGVS